MFFLQIRLFSNDLYCTLVSPKQQASVSSVCFGSTLYTLNDFHSVDMSGTALTRELRKNAHIKLDRRTLLATLLLVHPVFLLDYAPSLYILEAPFNRMLDEVRTFRVATLASRLLDLELLLRDAKCEFDTQQWLREAKTKRFLILHAEDDKTIPYHLGEDFFISWTWVWCCCATHPSTTCVLHSFGL